MLPRVLSTIQCCMHETNSENKYLMKIKFIQTNSSLRMETSFGAKSKEWTGVFCHSPNSPPQQQRNQTIAQSRFQIIPFEFGLFTRTWICVYNWPVRILLQTPLGISSFQIYHFYYTCFVSTVLYCAALGRRELRLEGWD